MTAVGAGGHPQKSMNNYFTLTPSNLRASLMGPKCSGEKTPGFLATMASSTSAEINQVWACLAVLSLSCASLCDAVWEQGLELASPYHCGSVSLGILVKNGNLMAHLWAATYTFLLFGLQIPLDKGMGRLLVLKYYTRVYITLLFWPKEHALAKCFCLSCEIIHSSRVLFSIRSDCMVTPTEVFWLCWQLLCLAFHVFL